MVETVIDLKPADQWRNGMTPDKPIGEMNHALNAKMTGFSNSWTMPIKARIDMLSTGIRTRRCRTQRVQEIGRKRAKILVTEDVEF